MQQFTIRFVINIIGAVMVIYWQWRHWIDFSDDVEAENRNREKFIVLQKMQNDSYFNIYYHISILNAIQFFRLMLAFRLNRLFGPMAKTMASMFVDVLQFLGLFFTIFVVFMASGTLLFSELPEYKDYTDAFNTLFAASFANYDPTIYANSQNVEPFVGYIFISVYLIVSSVLLLNFLIAILSTTYSSIQEQKNGLYIQEVIQHMQRNGYHPKYSSLVTATVPFNILFLPLTPLIISTKSETLNNIIQHVQYSPLAIIVVLIFFIFTLLFVPFAYVVHLFNKFRKSLFYSKGDCAKGHCWYIIDLLLFLPFGFFILLFSVFIDTYNFASHLYYPHLKLINEQQEDTNKDTNYIMDGSISNEHIQQLNVELSPLDLKRRFSNKLKRFNSNLNPIREGLSLTTMGILKITLLRILKIHLKLVNNSGMSGKNKFFVPVTYLILRMRINLMIEEQLNKMLFGFTYEKKEDYFKTENFKIIVDGHKHALYDKFEKFHQSEDNFVDKEEFWRNKLKKFLIKSNEKWILDQFNLIKLFLMRNSWEADLL